MAQPLLWVECGLFFLNYEVVATGITGGGEDVEVRDANSRAVRDEGYYIVVVEGDV